LGKYNDISITCSQCGKNFVFTEDEQEFYKTKGYIPPLRCKQCRSAKKAQVEICNRCGNELLQGAPVYCAACYIDIGLDHEVKSRAKAEDIIKLESSINDLESSLKGLEIQKSRLESELQSREIMIQEKSTLVEQSQARIAELEQAQIVLSEKLSLKQKEVLDLTRKLEDVSAELKKNLDQKSGSEKQAPAFDIREKLECLERNQNQIKDIIVELVKRNHNHQKNPGILDSVKTIFGNNRSSA